MLGIMRNKRPSLYTSCAYNRLHKKHDGKYIQVIYSEDSLRENYHVLRGRLVAGVFVIGFAILVRVWQTQKERE